MVMTMIMMMLMMVMMMSIEQVEAKQMEHSVVDGRFHLDRFLQFGWMVEELKEHL